MHAMASQPAPENTVRRDYAGEAGRGFPASASASASASWLVPLRSQCCVMIRAALERKVLSRARITDDCGEEREADRERAQTLRNCWCSKGPVPGWLARRKAAAD
jgi:hypothetical protein